MITKFYKCSKSFWVALLGGWFIIGGSGSLCVVLVCYCWLWVTQVIPVFKTTE